MQHEPSFPNGAPGERGRKNSARMGKESGMEFLPPLPVVLLRFRFIVKYF